MVSRGNNAIGEQIWLVPWPLVHKITPFALFFYLALLLPSLCRSCVWAMSVWNSMLMPPSPLRAAETFGVVSLLASNAAPTFCNKVALGDNIFIWNTTPRGLRQIDCASLSGVAGVVASTALLHFSSGD